MDFQGGWNVWCKKWEVFISYRVFFFWEVQKPNWKKKIFFFFNPEGFYNLAAQSASTELAILVSPEPVRNGQIYPIPDLHQNLHFWKTVGCLKPWQFEEHCFRICLAQLGKNLPAMQEIQVLFLGQEDPMEKEMATHSSILAWNLSWTEEPGSPWGRKSRTWLSN